MFSMADGSANYASSYLAQPIEVADRPQLQQLERQTPVLDVEVETLASIIYREMEAKNQLFILDQEFEKRYKAELRLPAVSEKHWKIAKYHFRSMARHKGDPPQGPHGAGSLNGSRPSMATSDDSLPPVHQPVAQQHMRRADSGEVSGRFSIPAVRPPMKHAAKANNKAMMTFLNMVQDASPNDPPPPPPKPPMHGPLPIMEGMGPLAPPRPPRTVTPPESDRHPSLAALSDVVMPLVQSMATMAYEVQQERCAMQQERSCVRALLEELRQERAEHRQLLINVLQAFRAANTGAVKVVQNDVHRSAAVALVLAASMTRRPKTT